jgi:hypothetical protein
MTMRNHVLATESLVVRGLVSPLVERLGDLLRNSPKHFVTVRDAEVRRLPGDEVRSAEIVRVGIRAILWAHEFVALTGDEFRRRHHEREEEHPVILTMDRPEGLTIAGWQSDASSAQDLPFFVVKKPRAEGATPLSAKHAEIISALPYILVNRDAPAAVLEGAPRSE